MALMGQKLRGVQRGIREWRDSSAILTVNTMSAADTIKAIDDAYREITARDAERLIIDL